MFKVEIEFDKNLPAEQVEELCNQVDQIFAEQDIPCAQSDFGKRTYEDKVDKVTLGSIGILLHRLKLNTDINNGLAKAVGVFENETADLLADYIRV